MFLIADGVLSAEVAEAAQVQLTRVVPETFVPPLPGAEVRRAVDDERDAALDFDDVERRLPAGLSRDNDPIYLDFDFLDGTKGAHVNISGISGVATKTSYATFLLYAMFSSGVLGAEAMHTKGLIFNVKGEDLLFLDHANTRLDIDERLRYSGTLAELESRQRELDDDAWLRVVVREPRRAGLARPHQDHRDRGPVPGSHRQVRRMRWLRRAAPAVPSPSHQAGLAGRCHRHHQHDPAVLALPPEGPSPRLAGGSRRAGPPHPRTVRPHSPRPGPSPRRPAGPQHEAPQQGSVGSRNPAVAIIPSRTSYRCQFARASGAGASPPRVSGATESTGQTEPRSALSP